MNYFEKSKVRGGIYVLSESAPDWVRDAVRKAHVGTLPHDWVYSVCKDFFDVYDAASVKDPYGFAHEFADGQVDIYINTLAQWYADNCLTSFMAQADEELEELGLNHGHLSDQIKALQHIALRRIAETLIEACQNNAKVKCVEQGVSAMNYLEESKRQPGIYVLSESAPEWVRRAVYKAHSGSPPDNWVYMICKNFFDAYAIETVKEPDDFAHEFADGQVDIYNNTLAEWYSEHCLSYIVSEAEEELKDTGLNYVYIIDQIRALQHITICRIAHVLIQACQNNQEENTQ